MDEKELAQRMKENPDLQIDPSVTVSKRCDRCSFTNGVHDMDCPTNNEYDFYPCIRCNNPVVQYSMKGGLCQDCQGFDPIRTITNIRDEPNPIYLTDHEIWYGRKVEPGEKVFEGLDHLIGGHISGNVVERESDGMFIPTNELAGKIFVANPPPSISALFDLDKINPEFKSNTERQAWNEWLPTIEYVWVDYEPIILKVAGANYKPDIALLRPDGRLWFVEVKGAGGWKAYKSGRSSKRSLKQCSRYYAWLGDFYLLMKIPNKDGGGWHFEQY